MRTLKQVQESKQLNILFQVLKKNPNLISPIKIGDIILSVNGKGAHSYSLQDIIQMFYGDAGKRISLLIDRDGIQMKFHFKLENLL